MNLRHTAPKRHETHPTAPIRRPELVHINVDPWATIDEPEQETWTPQWLTADERKVA